MWEVFVSYGLKSLVSKLETKDLETQNLTKSFQKIRVRRIEKFFWESSSLLVYLLVCVEVLVESSIYTWVWGSN